MSAWFSPVWGRAAPTLSIFTTIAGRSTAVTPSPSGRPVSGWRGVAGTVVSVVVSGTAVVGTTMVVVDAGGS
jgi:hypothetical protein